MQEEQSIEEQLVGEEIVGGGETSTFHDHFYEVAGVNENDLLDVVCACGHGMQVDRKTTIVEGKLVSPSV